MILDLAGKPATRTTETTFSPQLVLMLMGLTDLLHQNGLALVCMRCDRLGLKDGVQVDARPDSDEYRMICGCATRVFNKRTGHEKVNVA